MKLVDIFRLALGNLSRNRLRTILTVSGVAIGIGAIIFLVSLGFGLQNLSIQRITSIKALNIINIEKAKNPSQLLTKEVVEKIKTIDSVSTISPSYFLFGKIKLDSKETQCSIWGIDPKSADLEDIVVDLGKPFSEASPSDIVLSRAALNVFDIKEASEALGKEVLVNIIVTDEAGNIIEKDNPATQQKLKIIGITKEDKQNNAYIPLQNLEGLNLKTYQTIKIDVASRDKVKDVKKTVENWGYVTTSVEETITRINQIFLIVNIILFSFGMIALLVASIGIFNTMTIALLERTHEIGIMKAIGALDKDIRRIFITESAIIGLGGGLLGVIFGYLLGRGANNLVNFLATSFGGQAYNIFYTPPNFALGTVLFSLIVSIIAGIYPSRRASRLNPVEALRYE